MGWEIVCPSKAETRSGQIYVLQILSFGYRLVCMTEMAFPLDELDGSQRLRRQGSPFWRGGKLRESPRVAIDSVPDKPRAVMILKAVRDFINAGGRIDEGAGDPVERPTEADPTGVKLPPKEVLQRIGATACESPVGL
jgi:hypothetical protein